VYKKAGGAKGGSRESLIVNQESDGREAGKQEAEEGQERERLDTKRKSGKQGDRRRATGKA